MDPNEPILCSETTDESATIGKIEPPGNEQKFSKCYKFCN